MSIPKNICGLCYHDKNTSNTCNRPDCEAKRPLNRLVISADAVCGNCGKPYGQHYFEKYGSEDRVYCFTDTNGDIFTDTPSDDKIFNMILDDNPDIYDQYLTRWQKANGHL